jgi:hypothetical protein
MISTPQSESGDSWTQYLFLIEYIQTKLGSHALAAAVELSKWQEEVLCAGAQFSRGPIWMPPPQLWGI